MMTALGLSGADGWPGLVAKYDPSLIQIVGCHLNCDTVSSDHSDPVPLHAARGVGNDGVAIVHLHADAAIRQDFDHRTFEFKHFFLSHRISSADQYLNKAPGSPLLLTGLAPPPAFSAFVWMVYL
jgi:hypothetical protein